MRRPLRIISCIMTLGNIAMAGYLLVQLRYNDSGENLDELFFRKVSP